MKDWIQAADEALEVMRRQADSELYRNLMAWLEAHREQAKEELCLHQPDDAVPWLHQRAVFFTELISELESA